MTNIASIKKPFTWEAYREAARLNPNLDLLAAFSFDHMPNAEVEAIANYMEAAAFQMQCSSEYMTRVVDNLRTNHITKH